MLSSYTTSRLRVLCHTSMKICHNHRSHNFQPAIISEFDFAGVTCHSLSFCCCFSGIAFGARPSIHYTPVLVVDMGFEQLMHTNFRYLYTGLI